MLLSHISNTDKSSLSTVLLDMAQFPSCNCQYQASEMKFSSQEIINNNLSRVFMLAECLNTTHGNLQYLQSNLKKNYVQLIIINSTYFSQDVNALELVPCEEFDICPPKLNDHWLDETPLDEFTTGSFPFKALMPDVSLCDVLNVGPLLLHKLLGDSCVPKENGEWVMQLFKLQKICIRWN